MEVSQKGQQALEVMEGFSAKAYLDVAGVPTIGFGDTSVRARKVKMGDTTTLEAAKAELALDLHDFKSGVEKYLVKAVKGTTRNQFDALVIFAYNVGLTNFASSSVLRNHLAGNFEAAAASFALWNKITVNGKKVVSKGLVNRRAKEVEIYLHSNYGV
ncbi:endolysin [Erwinia phage vEam_S_24]